MWVLFLILLLSSYEHLQSCSSFVISGIIHQVGLGLRDLHVLSLMPELGIRRAISLYSFISSLGISVRILAPKRVSFVLSE